MMEARFTWLGFSPFSFNLPSFLSSFVGFSGKIKLNDRTDLLRASGGASL